MILVPTQTEGQVSVHGRLFCIFNITVGPVSESILAP